MGKKRSAVMTLNIIARFIKGRVPCKNMPASVTESKLNIMRGHTGLLKKKVLKRQRMSDKGFSRTNF